MILISKILDVMDTHYRLLWVPVYVTIYPKTAKIVTSSVQVAADGNTSHGTRRPFPGFLKILTTVVENV